MQKKYAVKGRMLLTY